MIKKFHEFSLNENASFEYWYPMFQGRYYQSEERARDDVRNAVAHRNKQAGTMFKHYDADEIATMFTFVQDLKRKKDNWCIKPADTIKKAPKPKKEYVYETSKELRSKQVRAWQDAHEIEFGRYIGTIEWLPTKDKRIYGTETTNPANLERVKLALKEGNELPPILLDSDYGILDGHHRYEAALALKIKMIPVVIYYREDEEDDEE